MEIVTEYETRKQELEKQIQAAESVGAGAIGEWIALAQLAEKHGDLELAKEIRQDLSWEMQAW